MYLPCLGDRVGGHIGELVGIVGDAVLFGFSVGMLELKRGASDTENSLHTHSTSLVHGPVLVPAMFSFRVPD